MIICRLNDSGVLAHKDHLPVRLLAVGDVSRPGSEAAYRVGPLQCYGDSKYQNHPNPTDMSESDALCVNMQGFMAEISGEAVE